MVRSKYLQAYKNADLTNLVELYGDVLLVEIPKEEEIKTKSGLYIAESPKAGIESLAKDKPFFVHVLAVGKGFYNDQTGEDVPLNVQPGNIILIGANSAKRFSHMEIDGYEAYSIGITKESEIQLKFNSIEEYEQYFGRLNSALKAEVQS